MTKKLFALVVTIISSQSLFPQSNYCIQNRFSPQYYFDSSEIKIDSNVIYGWAEQWPSDVVDTLKMDLYYPDESIDPLTKRPFLMLIHGGAFEAGNRHDMDYLCMEMARRGFVTATMSYRLGWDCPATDVFSICVQCSGLNYNFVTATYRAVQDGRAAMRFICSNASAYEIDTSYLFIGGVSAGSITALHTTFWDQDEANSFCSWCVDSLGLLNDAVNTLPNNFTIKGVVDDCGAVSKDSVVLNNGNIPVVSFHDEFDCVVPMSYGQVISCFCTPFYWIAGSSVIYNELIQKGTCAELNVVPLSLQHCGYPEWNLANRASCFLKRIMCDSCTSVYNYDAYAVAECADLNVATVTPFSSTQNDFTIFPNPTTGDVDLTWSWNKIETEGSISVFNVMGRKVYESNFHAAQESQHLDLHYLDEGVYTILLRQGNEVTRDKIVLMK